MAKRKNKPELTGVAAEAEAAADANGMCVVTALIDGVRDNGNRYEAGEEFHMHKHLVKPHVEAGQVELKRSGSAQPGTAAEKEATTPANKQVTPPATK